MWYLNFKKHEYYAFMEDAFTDEECDSIIASADDLKDASIMNGVDTTNLPRETIDKNIRKNKIDWIVESESSRWLYEKCSNIVHRINQQFWEFDLEYMETLQFTRYEEIGDGYKEHLDLGVNPLTYRKLSFSIQLSDSNEYEGSDLVIKPSSHPIYTSRKKGTVNFFPSYMLHEVTPLLSGKRDAIVGWVCGPSFK